MPLSDIFMENYRTCCTESKTRLKVKAVGQDKCLDFNPDRLEAPDWQPFMKALRSDRKLHTLAIKSEYPGDRRKCWADRVKPAFHKQSIVDELVESIAACMKRSDILSTVQLRSLPLTRRHVERLADAIRECTSLQNLLLTRFGLDDDGLETLYESIYPHVGLTTVDLTGCGLTARGAQTVAKIIRTQRLARYDETWKQSLRYRQPDRDLFPGIRRITLNDNPGIGDEGFLSISHELMDDLWVKAVDVQNCGLTEASGDEAVRLLEINDTVTILDLSRNDRVTYQTKSKIKRLLADKRAGESEATGEKGDGRRCNVNDGCRQTYDWLEGASELGAPDACESSRKPNSELSLRNVTGSSGISAEVDNPSGSRSHSHLTVELHQTKRVLDDTKRYLLKEREKREELENEKQLQKKKLAEKYTKEWNKRKRIEQERDRLKKELHVFLSEGHIPKAKSRKSSSTRSGKSKASKPKKSRPLSDCPDASAGRADSKSNRTCRHNASAAKSVRNKAAKKTLEKNKRPNGKDYEVSNTQQVQIMQKNLDKLNFNVPKERPMPPSDTESDFSCASCEQNADSKDDATATIDCNGDGDAHRDPRDLSPISRSQWIFNEIMIGKSRRQTDTEKNINSCFNDGNNEKSFRFDTNLKWDVKV